MPSLQCLFSSAILATKFYVLKSKILTNINNYWKGKGKPFIFMKELHNFKF